MASSAGTGVLKKRPSDRSRRQHSGRLGAVRLADAKDISQQENIAPSHKAPEYKTPEAVKQGGQHFYAGRAVATASCARLDHDRGGSSSTMHSKQPEAHCPTPDQAWQKDGADGGQWGLVHKTVNLFMSPSETASASKGGHQSVTPASDLVDKGLDAMGRAAAGVANGIERAAANVVTTIELLEGLFTPTPTRTSASSKAKKDESKKSSRLDSLPTDFFSNLLISIHQPKHGQPDMEADSSRTRTASQRQQQQQQQITPSSRPRNLQPLSGIENDFADTASSSKASTRPAHAAQPIGGARSGPDSLEGLALQLQGDLDHLQSSQDEGKRLRQRMGQLQEENSQLRMETSMLKDSDALAEQVRAQLEALLLEKARLAQENARLARENSGLHELLSYSMQMSEGDVGDHANTEYSEEVDWPFQSPHGADSNCKTPLPALPESAESEGECEGKEEDAESPPPARTA